MWNKISTWQKMGAILTVLTGFVAFIISLPGIEPYFPATRAYVREVSDTTANNYTAAVKTNTAGILDLKVLQLDEAISNASTYLDMLAIRLRDDPNDPLLLKIKADTETRLTSLRELRKTVSCQRVLISLPNFRCP